MSTEVTHERRSTPTRMTAQEYLIWESAQPEKHEYIAGEVFAMTGARLNHNLIVGERVRAPQQALRGLPCGVFMSDVKLQVAAARCLLLSRRGGHVRPERPGRRHCAERSPALADRRGAFRQHRGLRPRQEVRAATARSSRSRTTCWWTARRPHAELFRKNAEGFWVLHPLGSADTLRIEQPHGFDWPVGSLFEDVPFEPAAPIMDAG